MYAQQQSPPPSDETAVAERDFFPTDFMYIVRSGTSSFCFEWFSKDESLSIYF